MRKFILIISYGLVFVFASISAFAGEICTFLPSNKNTTISLGAGATHDFCITILGPTGTPYETNLWKIENSKVIQFGVHSKFCGKGVGFVELRAGHVHGGGKACVEGSTVPLPIFSTPSLTLAIYNHVLGKSRD